MEYKEFQKAAIKKIVNGYESSDKNNRFLVADEVGLGKTIIAKGTIRSLFYFEYLKQQCPEKYVYNVLYLCSNLNIAEQNKSKLGVSKRDRANLMDDVILGHMDFECYKGNFNEEGSSVENRTTMLLKKLLENVSENSIEKHFQEIKVMDLHKACVEIYGEQAIKEREAAVKNCLNDETILRLNIIPITTKTSIQIKGTGHQIERAFILEILYKLQKQKDSNSNVEQMNILREFEKKLGEIKKKYPKICNSPEFEKQLIEKVNTLDSSRNFQLDLLGLVSKIEENQKSEWEKLRQQFALASVELLKYDFVIMDEFQNFSEILHRANETESKKKSYVSKAEYIYLALKASNRFDELADEISEEYIRKTNGENIWNNLSMEDEAFWRTELQSVEFDGRWDIEELIGTFSKLAENRLRWKKIYEGQSIADKEKKENLLFLVKSILNRSDAVHVNKAYKEISGDTMDFVWGKVEEIELESQSGEAKSSYTKSVIELYQTEAEEKNVLLQCWQEYFFQNWYGRLRDCGNIRWYSRKKQVPFRYLLNLHFATKGMEKDVNISNLILNCFIFFSEDAREKLYLWQYAYLLTEKLAGDENRLSYTVEQLEPLRVMLGEYVKSQNSDFDLVKKCENIVIEKIFNNEFQNGHYTRILMLSATPFRMYITEGDNVENNANILEVCDFLDTNLRDNLGNKLIDYKEALLQYALGTGTFVEGDGGENVNNTGPNVLQKKKNFQGAMNQVFTRMERFAVLRKLVEEWFVKQAECGKNDELVCGKIKELWEYLMQARRVDQAGAIISYAEDAPYMGTFMHGITAGSNSEKKKRGDDNENLNDEGDGYKWKRKFDYKVKQREIQFEENSYLYVTKKEFIEKKKPLGMWHGVYEGALKQLLELDCIDTGRWEKEHEVDSLLYENHPGAARLLWIPSYVSVKKNKVKGPFKEHSDYGKTIIFSRLVQVPRMIAGLTGYEVLRRLTWLIEENCREKGIDIAIFDKVLCALGCEIKQGASTYQKLECILENLENSLEKQLLSEETGTLEENLKSIKCICKDALERYCENYTEGKQATNDKLESVADSLAKNLVHRVLLNKQQGMFAIWAVEGFGDGVCSRVYDLEDSDEKDKLRADFLKDCCTKVLRYCENGCLSDVLDEWLYICFEGEQDLGEFLGMNFGLKNVECLSFIRSTQLSVSLYECDEAGNLKSSSEQINKDGEKEETSEKINTYFARCVGMSKDDDKVSSIKGLQQSFNSPFAPFVFATTSMGQEGLDFHHYADKIMHWRLPANPVDFEQREGRINRYHCLALRKKLIEWYGDLTEEKDIYKIYQSAFENATQILLQDKDNRVVNCGLVPDWVLLNQETKESVSIKRYVPYFCLSRTNEDFHKNLKVLQLYRSVIGQTDPQEVMERLMNNRTVEEVAELFVDFSPYNYKEDADELADE